MAHNTGVYRIRNLVSQDCYIGSAAGKEGFAHRFYRHRSDLKCQRHSNALLQNVWNKYGADAFVFEILLYCDPQDCLTYEQIAIDTMKPRYNINQCASSRLGMRPSRKTCQKISLSMSGSKNPHYGKRGENAPHFKLTANDVAEIRRLLLNGMSQSKIAHRFSVSQAAISNIKMGKSWCENV